MSGLNTEALRGKNIDVYLELTTHEIRDHPHS